MDVPRKRYMNSRLRVIHAIIGVTIFLLLNGLLLGLAITSGWFSHEPGTLILGLTALLVNIGLLIYFGFTRYWLSLGPLALFVFLSVGVLLFSAACFPAPPIPAPTWTPLPTVAPQSPLEPPITATVPITQLVPITETAPITNEQPVSPTWLSD